jgi:hypothetical protein
MNRQPEYAQNNPGYRIVSVPNGLWRLQERREGEGTRTSDPWVSMSPSMEHREAREVLGRYAKGAK